MGRAVNLSSVADSSQNFGMNLGRIVLSNGPDIVVWSSNEDLDYSARIGYDKLAAVYQTNQVHDGSNNRVVLSFAKCWKTSVPFQIKAFGWRILHDRLATKNNLLIRGIIHSPSDLLCPFCLDCDESLLHLLSYCSVSREVWSRVAMWAGFVNRVEGNIGQHFLVWADFFKKKKVRSGNEGIVWLAVWWTVWRARNEIVFNDEKISVSDLIWDIKILAWKWSFIRNISYTKCNFYEFAKDPVRFLS
ncbi:uncharacterized protein LOC131630531 [Vicia villosa]|uniref:uncharacterized protein LOC131630531 n=1 Tax=Vicia villosa TaxID=3911 RepID=UPI00273C6189|nr:uncharacterized protein LOC131630531 [Vicia villosa]